MWTRTTRMHESENDDCTIAREVLRTFVAKHPDDVRVADLLERIGEPLIDRCPRPNDALAGLVRGLAPRHGAGVPSFVLHAASTSPEAPSNVLALALLARAHGRAHHLTLDVLHPWGPERYGDASQPIQLYRRQGDDLVPALAPPTPAVASEIAAIAALPYQLSLWLERATVLGRALGRARAGELLSALVHPPDLPDPSEDAASWVMRTQVVAALALAGLDAGWHGSERRRLLLALSTGAIDWTLTAVIVALLAIVREEPRAHADVVAAFYALRAREPRHGYCPYAVPLRQAWLRLPNVDPALQRALERELAERLDG